MSLLLSSIFDGISIGSVLLIAALGLAVVFGLMGVINLAHGELIMLGAYTTFVVQNVFKPLGEPWFGLYIFVALPLAFLVSGLVGLGLERGIIRYLYGRPLETLLATWGVSLILQQFVRSVNGLLAIAVGSFALLFWGGLWLVQRRPDGAQLKTKALKVLLPLSLAIAGVIGLLIYQSQQMALINPWFSARNVDVTAPAWLKGGLPLGSFQVPYIRLFIIVLTIICVLGTYWFLNKSSWGLRIRSVMQNRTMSACLGIPTDKVDALTFALGSGLAGIAGCGISFLGSVGPNTGQNYIVDTFMVVVVGGVGNLLGTIVAALAIGVINYLVIVGSSSFAVFLASTQTVSTSFVAQFQAATGIDLVEFFNFFATTSMAKVIVFILIITFLQIKPAGLFPQKGRTAEL